MGYVATNTDAPLDTGEPLLLGEGDTMPEGLAEQPLDPIQLLAEMAARPNIAGDLAPDLLSEIAARVIEEYRIDKVSRADWEEEVRLATEAVLQKAEPKNYPFENASNVKYPVLTSAALQFGARTYPAVCPGDRVVKAKVVGPDRHGLKQARGERVSVHMSYQLTKQMKGWEADMDMLVHQIPVAGHVFKKVYRDPVKGRICSVMRPAINVVVHQSTRDLDSVPRITDVIDDLYPHQIDSRIRAGTFIAFDYGSAQPRADAGAGGATAASPSDADAPHVFLEQHRYEDLDGDGLREPWIVTVHEATATVVRVVAGYDIEKAEVAQDGVIIDLPRENYFIGYPFLPDPNGGYYGIGYGRLLRALGEAVNTTLNQIIDAGHLQNAGGGFIGSGLNVKKSTMRVEMNKWTMLSAAGKTIREAVVPHDFRGPSPVLFQVLGLLLEASKTVASVQDVLTGEASAKTMQPTTLLALIEQGLKVYTSIVKRLFRSLGEEFTRIFDLNRRYPDEAEYQAVIDWEPPEHLVKAMQAFQELKAMHPQAAAAAAAEGAPPPPEPQLPFPEAMLRHLEQPTMAGDYDDLGCDIVPVADPSAVTDMQRMAKAQIIEANMGHPNLNREQALRRIFQAANVEDADQLVVATPAGPDPLLAENAKSQIARNYAGARRDEAQAAKTEMETQGVAQDIAADYAAMASGAADEDRALSAETRRLQENKTQREMALKERQQQTAERDMRARARGEAA
jgi:chaperonin GroES